MYILERKLKVVDDGTSNLFPRFMVFFLNIIIILVKIELYLF